MGPGQPGLWTAVGQQMEGQVWNSGPGRLLTDPQRCGGEWKAVESEEEKKLDLAQTQHTWRTGGGGTSSSHLRRAYCTSGPILGALRYLE